MDSVQNFLFVFRENRRLFFDYVNLYSVKQVAASATGGGRVVSPFQESLYGNDTQVVPYEGVDRCL